MAIDPIAIEFYNDDYNKTLLFLLTMHYERLLKVEKKYLAAFEEYLADEDFELAAWVEIRKNLNISILRNHQSIDEEKSRVVSNENLKKQIEDLNAKMDYIYHNMGSLVVALEKLIFENDYSKISQQKIDNLFEDILRCRSDFKRVNVPRLEYNRILPDRPAKEEGLIQFNVTPIGKHNIFPPLQPHSKFHHTKSYASLSALFNIFKNNKPLQSKKSNQEPSQVPKAVTVEAPKASFVTAPNVLIITASKAPLKEMMEESKQQPSLKEESKEQIKVKLPKEKSKEIGKSIIKKSIKRVKRRKMIYTPGRSVTQARQDNPENRDLNPFSILDSLFNTEEDDNSYFSKGSFLRL